MQIESSRGENKEGLFFLFCFSFSNNRWTKEKMLMSMQLRLENAVLSDETPMLCYASAGKYEEQKGRAPQGKETNDEQGQGKWRQARQKRATRSDDVADDDDGENNVRVYL